MKPLMIAHRGDIVHYPENTFEAFESAFALGADGVECDLHENKGNIIIVHPHMYDKSKDYPLLDDFLVKFSDKGRLEIELKEISEQFVQKVAKIIDEYEPKDYLVTSSILPLLPAARRCMPKANIGMIFRKDLLETWMTEEFKIEYLRNYLLLTKSNTLNLDLDNYTENLAKALHRYKFRLHSHLSDTDLSKYKKLVSLGIDECTFNDIEILEKIR